jgi:hypothetical protein
MAVKAFGKIRGLKDIVPLIGALRDEEGCPCM